MFAFGKSPLTRQKWLEDLGRRLAWSFPEPQAKEILTDFQAQFEAGREYGKSDAEIIDALGTPREAVAQLLEEEPAARTEQLRYTLLWLAAAAVCWAFGWLCLYSYFSFFLMVGFCAFVPMTASTLFMLLRGPARIALERLVPPEKTASRTVTFLLPAAAMLACTTLQEIAIITVMRLHIILIINIGAAITTFLLIFIIAMLVLAAWFLLRSVTRSIRYFPGVVHALGGAAGSALFMTRYYKIVDVDPLAVPPELEILVRLLPYFTGLFTALAFQRWVDGRKPLPLCFQAKAVTWTDWRHHLGVNLLGWYDPEQAAEIVADYQEQYELGRERGRSVAGLLSEFGRPTAVTRALLQEDRKARLRSRKNRLWAIPFLASLLLLYRMILSFNFGSIFFDAALEQVVGCLFLLLGSISLFMLLHGRGRAALEERFPANKQPTVWVYLLPLLCMTAVMGWMVYSFCHPELEIIGHAIPWLLLDLIRFFILVMFLLQLWTLSRCVSGAIRYFPAAVHTAGSIAGMLAMGTILYRLDIEYSLSEWASAFPSVEMFQVVLSLPYLLGVLLAAIFWLVLRAAGKPCKES